jgi:hypothetical protein
MERSRPLNRCALTLLLNLNIVVALQAHPCLYWNYIAHNS